MNILTNHSKTKSEQISQSTLPDALREPHSHRQILLKQHSINNSPPKGDKSETPSINVTPFYLPNNPPVKPYSFRKFKSLDITNTNTIASTSINPVTTTPSNSCKKIKLFKPKDINHCNIKFVDLKGRNAFDMYNKELRNNSYGNYAVTPQHNLFLHSKLNNNNNTNVNNYSDTKTCGVVLPPHKMKHNMCLHNISMSNERRSGNGVSVVRRRNHLLSKENVVLTDCDTNYESSQVDDTNKASIDVDKVHNKYHNNNNKPISLFNSNKNVNNVNTKYISTTSINQDTLRLLNNNNIKHSQLYINRNSTPKKKENFKASPPPSLIKPFSPYVPINNSHHKQQCNINEVNNDNDSDDDDDNTIIEQNITSSTINDYLLSESKPDPKYSSSINIPEEEHKGVLKIHSFKCESNFKKFHRITHNNNNNNTPFLTSRSIFNTTHHNSSFQIENILSNITTIFKYNNIHSISHKHQQPHSYNLSIKQLVFPHSQYKSKIDADQFYTKHSIYSSKYKDEIERDLTRTFPDKPLTTLYNDKLYTNLKCILNVYAFSNENIGYAQGMNFIVASSLLLFNDNVDVFYFLDGLIRALNLEELYGVNNKLKRRMDEIGTVIQLHVPQLHMYLVDCGLSHEFITVNWALTLFSNTMTSNMLFCIWDFMILCGWEFFNAFVVVVLKRFEKDLLKTAFERLSGFMKKMLKTDEFERDFEKIVKSAVELMIHIRKGKKRNKL